MHIVMFDQRLIDLQHEIVCHHPHIIELCTWTAQNNQGGDDLYMQLAEIGAACGVVVEGDFGREDVYKLCEFLTKHLVKSRTILVTPNQ